MEKLRRMPPLDECEFVLLSADYHERIRKLRDLGPGTVYIWGDGHDHHESLLLTDEGTGLKVNIDDHCDRGDDRFITYGNHMTHVERRGIPIITPRMGIGQQQKREDLFRRMDHAVREATPDSVHLTVDLDAVTGFPAWKNWICTDGMSIDAITRCVAQLNGRLRTLDLGGLAKQIPDFQLVDVEAYQPDAARTAALLHGEVGRDPRVEIDSVFSYATRAYYEILTAALTG